MIKEFRMKGVHHMVPTGFHQVESPCPSPERVHDFELSGSVAHQVRLFVLDDQRSLVNRNLLIGLLLQQFLAPGCKLLGPKVYQRVFLYHAQGQIVSLVCTFFFSFESQTLELGLLVLYSVVAFCWCEFRLGLLISLVHRL